MRHWPIKLHEAMQIVLRDRFNYTATTDVIASEINTRRLYVQRDGGPIVAEQIFLRARKYPELFLLKGRNIVQALTQHAFNATVSPAQSPKQTAKAARPKRGKSKMRANPAKAPARIPREATIRRKAARRRLREEQLAEQRREERKLGAGKWHPPVTRPTMPEEL